MLEKEQTELLAEGKCFNCKEVGLFTRNCPRNNTVRTTGGSKAPPGVSNFSVELEPHADSDMEDSVEVLDSLPLGALSFDSIGKDGGSSVLFWPLAEWREHYPRWNEPGILARSEIGDCYAMQADSVLTLEQPYPGDERYTSTSLRPELRFRVIRQANRPRYTIHDHLTNFRVSLKASLLANPNFDISRWYAKRRAKALNLTGALTH